MKLFQRVLAGFLTAIMLIGYFPQPISATEAVGSDAVLETEDLSVSGTNGFGSLVSDAIMENQQENEESGEEYENGYSVTDLTFSGNIATVTYEAMEDAILVVGVYSEDGMKVMKME